MVSPRAKNHSGIKALKDKKVITKTWFKTDLLILRGGAKNYSPFLHGSNRMLASVFRVKREGFKSAFSPESSDSVAVVSINQLRLMPTGMRTQNPGGRANLEF